MAEPDCEAGPVGNRRQSPPVHVPVYDRARAMIDVETGVIGHQACTGTGMTLAGEKRASDTVTPAIWTGFAMMCVGMFMAILDVQVVATSLPTIQQALNIA